MNNKSNIPFLTTMNCDADSKILLDTFWFHELVSHMHGSANDDHEMRYAQDDEHQIQKLSRDVPLPKEVVITHGLHRQLLDVVLLVQKEVAVGYLQSQEEYGAEQAFVEVQWGFDGILEGCSQSQVDYGEEQVFVEVQWDFDEILDGY